MAAISFVSLLSSVVPFEEKLLRFVCFQTTGETSFFLRPNRALGVFVDRLAAPTAHFEVVLLPDDDDWVQLRTARDEYLAVSDMPLRPLNLTKSASAATQFRLEHLGDDGGFALRCRKTDKWVKPAPGYWATGTGSEPTSFQVHRMPSFHAKRVCSCPSASEPASGIDSGSVASGGPMSPVPLANGGSVEAGSLTAILQSIGAAGLSAGTSSTIGKVEAIISSIGAAALLARSRGNQDLCSSCEGVLQKREVPRFNVIDFQLILSVEDDDLADLEVLLQAGADVHARYVEGTTLLHVAAARNCIRVVPRLMIEIDVNSRDRHGCTALFYAAANHCSEVVQLLLDSGASRDCIPQNEEDAEPQKAESSQS